MLDWAGLEQTIPKHACFAAGTQVTVSKENNWLFLLSSALGKRMPEVFCKACQKETFLYNQTVWMLTSPWSSCPLPPQKRSCSAPGLHGRMLVEWSSWSRRPLQSRLATWSMAGPCLDAWADTGAFWQYRREQIKPNCPPEYRGMKRKRVLRMGNGFLRTAFRPGSGGWCWEAMMLQSCCKHKDARHGQEGKTPAVGSWQEWKDF